MFIIVNETLKCPCLQNCPLSARYAPANGEVERQNRSLLKRLQIAQAEKSDWKLELRKYIMAYTSIPHNTTGKSPAELLFRRKFRTKLPDLSNYDIQVYDQDVRDRDYESKSASKAYIDNRRGAQYSDVNVGDSVLVQQDKRDKLTTKFNPTPHVIVSKQGNSVITQSPDGAQYSRNTTHVRKYHTPDSFQHGEERDEMNNEMLQHNDDEVVKPGQPDNETVTSATEQLNLRPMRSHKLPQKYNDYVVKI